MDIVLVAIPIAMLSFYAGLAVGSVAGTNKAYKEGIRFGRRLEKRRLHSYRNLGMFRPDCEYMIGLDTQEADIE